MNETRINLHAWSKAFASRDKLKPAILGVYYSHEKRLLFATDGHKACELMDASIHVTISASKDCIIPVGAFCEYEKITRGISQPARLTDYRIYIGDALAEIQELINGKWITRASIQLIGEQYPEYDFIFPENSTGQESQDCLLNTIGVNPVYLAEIYEGFKSWGCPPALSLTFTELSAITVRMLPEHIGAAANYRCIIMPIRLKP